MMRRTCATPRLTRLMLFQRALQHSFGAKQAPCRRSVNATSRRVQHFMLADLVPRLLVSLWPLGTQMLLTRSFGDGAQASATVTWAGAPGQNFVRTDARFAMRLSPYTVGRCPKCIYSLSYSLCAFGRYAGQLQVFGMGVWKFEKGRLACWQHLSSAMAEVG